MQHPPRARRRALLPLAAAALAMVAPLAAPSAGTAATSSSSPNLRYRNPILHGVADTFADPSVIRGKDGWWYAYGTSDPLKEGQSTPRLIPIVRSKDLVHWAYVHDTFTTATLPKWADQSRHAALWAPDIRYVDGQYRMYYVVTETTVTSEPNDNAIGMATAPTPAGPWTDSGSPVVPPRRGASGNPGDFLWTFDPSVVTDVNGTQKIVYGSYYGGIWMQPLDGAGKHTTGSATQVAIDNKFEGAYPIRRGGYWYLFASTANCCAGPTTGYSVEVGRSRNLAGPYVDKQGIPLLASRTGGTPVLYQNGNRWIGTGHNAILTDLSGQQWIVYHAIDRNDPYLNGTDGINQRPMLLDRLDWVGGWPVVNGGSGPSDDRRRAPRVTGNALTTVDAPLTRWTGRAGWRVARETGNRYLVARRPALLLFPVDGRNARVEADVRGTRTAGVVLRGRARPDITAVLNPSARTLTLRSAGAQRTVRLSHDAGGWHSVALEVRGRTAYAEVSNARLGDPLATATLRLGAPLPVRSAGGAVATAAGAQVDNVSAFTGPTRVRLAAPHKIGRVLPRQSDEFNGTSLGSGWTWVRGPKGTVSGGALQWPTEVGDLVGPANAVSVLLRTATPDGAWTAETKVTNNFGTTTVRNYQDAGLIAYVNDDLFLRLATVAIWDTRQNEFGKEMPYAGRLSYGGTIIGPPAATTWLRLVHRYNSKGEHVLTAYSSTNGRTWVRGGAWTLPAGSKVRVGLVSQGAQAGEPAGHASFDWFRLRSS